MGNAAQGGAKTDGADVACFAADAALDLLPGQAGVADVREDVPRRGGIILDERAGRAHAHALGAEGAGSVREIDDREAAVAAAIASAVSSGKTLKAPLNMATDPSVKTSTD